jgi:DNA polymerase-3 subunit delta'
LKTLEEPTGAVHFILVTRAKSSLLDTILSRCMHVGFGSIPEAELARALVQRGIPEGAAAELAALSDGSFGRALELYENDGLKLRDDAAKFLRERAQLTVQDVFARGAAMEKLPREQLTEWFLYLGMLLRDLLVLYEDGASPLLYHKDLRADLAAMLEDYPERRIAALLALVRETDRRLQSNVNQRLLLEGFFLRAMES